MTPSGDALDSDARTPSPRPLVDIIPFDLLDPTLSPVVAANLQAMTGRFIRVVSPRPRPEFAYMATRRQFDATKIIAELAAETDGAPFKLGIIRHDLCVPILTYVYGESQIGGRAAVISSHRLFDRRPEVVYERMAKIGIHEVGHLFGLNHCWELDCLMRFSKQLEQLDQLPMYFCKACMYEIKRMLTSGELNPGQKTSS
jgi:archaemetzincin